MCALKKIIKIHKKGQQWKHLIIELTMDIQVLQSPTRLQTISIKLKSQNIIANFNSILSHES